MSVYESPEDKDLCARAIRAHNRMHGESTWIEAHMGTERRVRVQDKELGIVTLWDTFPGKRAKVKFHKQLGERL